PLYLRGRVLRRQRSGGVREGALALRGSGIGHAPIVRIAQSAPVLIIGMIRIRCIAWWFRLRRRGSDDMSWGAPPPGEPPQQEPYGQQQWGQYGDRGGQGGYDGGPAGYGAAPGGYGQGPGGPYFPQYPPKRPKWRRTSVFTVLGVIAIGVAAGVAA